MNPKDNDGNGSNILKIRKRIITPEEAKNLPHAEAIITKDAIEQAEREMREYRELKRGVMWLNKEIRKICPEFFDLLKEEEYGGSGWDLILSGVKDGLLARKYNTILAQIFLYVNQYKDKDKIFPPNVLNELESMFAKEDV